MVENYFLAAVVVVVIGLIQCLIWGDIKEKLNADKKQQKAAADSQRKEILRLLVYAEMSLVGEHSAHEALSTAISNGNLKMLRRWRKDGGDFVESGHITDKELEILSNAFPRKKILDMIKCHKIEELGFLLGVLYMDPKRIIDLDTGGTIAHVVAMARAYEMITSLTLMGIDFITVKNGQKSGGETAREILHKDNEVMVNDTIDEAASIVAKRTVRKSACATNIFSS